MGSKHKHGDKLKWHQKVLLEVLWTLSRLIAASPRWFRYYVLRPIFFFVLFVMRYRRKVVLKNLEMAFPEKSYRERRRIMRNFYDTLAEIVVCTISLAGIKRERDNDVIVWANGKEHMERVAGRDWIAMGAHYGCWEYLLLWSWFDPSYTFIGVYHPLRSIVFEHLYRRFRRVAENALPVPMKDTLRDYLRCKANGERVALGLVSDQSPILHKHTEWYKFLNQDTAFVEGGDKLSERFHMPVYFANVRRVKRGCYEVYFAEIYDGREEVASGEITRRYASELEAMIRKRPELWMWSHRRWRHTPEKQAKKFGIEKKEARPL